MKTKMIRLDRFLSPMAVSAAALLTLTAMPSVGADYPTTVQSYHPVGYWRLNENTPVPVGDIATNSGSLAPAGIGRYIEGVVHPVPGIPGSGGNSAMHLTNANTQLTGFSKLRIPWQAALNPNGPFTVEFWARPDYPSQIGCPASSIDMILSSRLGWLFYQMNSAGSTGNGWQFRVYNTSGAVFNANVNDDALDSAQ